MDNISQTLVFYIELSSNFSETLRGCKYANMTTLYTKEHNKITFAMGHCGSFVFPAIF